MNEIKEVEREFEAIPGYQQTLIMQQLDKINPACYSFNISHEDVTLAVFFNIPPTEQYFSSESLIALSTHALGLVSGKRSGLAEVPS